MTSLRVLVIYSLLLGIECKGSRSFTPKPTNPEYHDGVIACTDGWLPFEGSCYLFGKNDLVFTEAEHFCQKHSSHLIHVDNSRENAFIKDYLHQLYPKNWWLGMTDKEVEGVWRWRDTNDSVSFTDWYPGQDHTESEDCAIFWISGAFKWGDYSCLGRLYPICETRGITCNPQYELVG